MISKVFRRLSTANFSTLSTPTSPTQPQSLKDYQYAKMIEQSSSMNSYNLLLHSYYNNVVLDQQTFKSVYHKISAMDGTYYEVLLKVFNHSFRTSKSLEQFQMFCGKVGTEKGKNSRQSLEQKHQEQDQEGTISHKLQSTADSATDEQQPAVSIHRTNPVLQDLMRIIKSAGESGSNLILNNVEIEFDYKYLYGNPLINEGLEDYGDDPSLTPDLDPNDILSCMKSIRIGEVQFVSPQKNAEHE